LTVGSDPRITRIGGWLRRLKLDELPQLFNVLAGEMSLVGPRPDVPCYVDRYQPPERRVLELVPGMTDPGASCFVEESTRLDASHDPERNYLTEIAPEKIRLSLAYAERASVWTDLRMILRTVRYLYGRSSGDSPPPRIGLAGADSSLDSSSPIR
jgi:lipopolysaccharide/colanic/teichoic acid biosynthesis glycosyltransferase